MWNKRNDDNYSNRQQSWPDNATTNRLEPRREAPPSLPQRTVVSEPTRPTASIGTSMSIKGEIRSREELFVDGEIEGGVDVQHCLTVGPNGKVRANIKAREVIIFGSVRGNVEVTEKISIRQNGSLVGDIKTSGIVIDDGAYFKGSIDIVKSEPAKKNAEAVQVHEAKIG